VATSVCRKCGAAIQDDFSRDGALYALDNHFRAWKCQNGEEHEPNIKQISGTNRKFVWIASLLHGIAGIVFLVTVGAFANHLFGVERSLMGISALTVWFTWMYKVSKWTNEQLDVAPTAKQLGR
jgi:hypothetical protein